MSQIKPKVIFVDDEVDMLEIYKLNFKDSVKSGKFELHCFENGKQCYDYISANASGIDIIFLLSDIKMPIMDGFSLLTKIKEEFPQIEVFMGSAFGDQANIEKARKLGAKDFFVKPVDLDDVEKIINTSLERHGF